MELVSLERRGSAGGYQGGGRDTPDSLLRCATEARARLRFRADGTRRASPAWFPRWALARRAFPALPRAATRRETSSAPTVPRSTSARGTGGSRLPPAATGPPRRRTMSPIPRQAPPPSWRRCAR
ncbi:hypothetical protein ACU4GD_37175 [Cupriavidus basilensis]